MTKVYYFYQATLRVFTTFNKLLQSEAPLIHYLHSEQRKCMSRLCSKFIKPRVIQESKANKESFLNLDISAGN